MWSSKKVKAHICGEITEANIVIPKNDRALSPASQTPCAAKDSTPADSFHWDVLQQFPHHSSLAFSIPTTGKHQFTPSNRIAMDSLKQIRVRLLEWRSRILEQANWGRPSFNPIHYFAIRISSNIFKTRFWIHIHQCFQFSFGSDCSAAINQREVREEAAM